MFTNILCARRFASPLNASLGGPSPAGKLCQWCTRPWPNDLVSENNFWSNQFHAVHIGSLSIPNIPGTKTKKLFNRFSASTWSAHARVSHSSKEGISLYVTSVVEVIDTYMTRRGLRLEIGQKLRHVTSGKALVSFLIPISFCASSPYNLCFTFTHPYTYMLIRMGLHTFVVITRQHKLY